LRLNTLRDEHAGSGKTTFMQRINAHLHAKKQAPYVLNLDPAVLSVPFEANIDIRDSINYKEVMKQYNLGPNGGILTSLNLFATKVDQILSLMEKRSKPSADSKTRPPRHFLIDTPGQIEVFVWSASGSILLESLASSFPTVIAYVIDTPRTSSTSTFMSNMLYACSILYKTKLPMILVFNKTDVQDADFAKDWMTDFEKFQEALHGEEEKGVFGGEAFGGGSGYMSSLLNSMSLMLEEFYSHLNMVAVSSTTGDGVDAFFEAVEVKRKEFNRDYKPELDKRRKQREEENGASKEQQLANVMKDLNMSAARRNKADKAESDIEEDEDENDPDQYADETNDEKQDDDLSSRYQAALRDSGVEGNTGNESFANYLASSQANT
jgi:GPN-loop GTPase